MLGFHDWEARTPTTQVCLRCGAIGIWRTEAEWDSAVEKGRKIVEKHWREKFG
jgi:hypothetical protein